MLHEAGLFAVVGQYDGLFVGEAKSFSNSVDRGPPGRAASRAFGHEYFAEPPMTGIDLGHAGQMVSESGGKMKEPAGGGQGRQAYGGDATCDE